MGKLYQYIFGSTYGFSIIATIILFCYSPLFASVPVPLSDDLRIHGKYLKILEDPGGELGIKDIQKPEFQSRFKSATKEIPDFGFSPSVFWVRLQIQNHTPLIQKRLLHLSIFTFIDFEVYSKNNENRLVRKKVGLSTPLQLRDFKHHFSMVELTLLPHQANTIFIRVEAKRWRTLLDFKLLSLKAFALQDSQEQYIYGLWYGILWVMILYNLFLFISIRNKSYLYYVLYLTAFLTFNMAQFGNILYLYVVPEAAWYLVQSSYLAVFAFLQFMKSFLHTRIYLPHTHKFLTVLGAAFLIALAFLITNINYLIAISIFNVLLLIVLCLAIYAGIRVWSLGFKPARFFVLAFSVLLAGSSLLALAFMGVLPFNVLTLHGPQVGSGLQVVFLSLALADRINLLKHQREQALKEKLKVVEKTVELREANKWLKTVSRTDGLTGVANRRYMDEFLAFEWRHAIRDKSLMSFILIDIDFFKLFNDHYGHPTGDECLKKVATRLQSLVHRPGDLVARYGGEEFALVLSDTENAIQMAENCRKAIEDLQIPHEKSKVAEVVTISVGIANIIPPQSSKPLSIIDLADKALYQAKDSGRNKVVEIEA